MVNVVALAIVLALVCGCGKATTHTDDSVLATRTNAMLHTIDRAGRLTSLASPRPQNVEGWATRNDNAVYSFDFTYFETNRPSLDSCHDLGLLVAGMRVDLFPGCKDDKWETYRVKGLDESNATLIAAAFGISIRRRLDPAVKLDWSIKPTRQEYTMGESMVLSIIVRNTGTTTVHTTQHSSWMGHHPAIGDVTESYFVNGKAYAQRQPYMTEHDFVIPRGKSERVWPLVLRPGDVFTGHMLLIGKLDRPGRWEIDWRAEMPLFRPFESASFFGERDDAGGPQAIWSICMTATNVVNVKRAHWWGSPGTGN